MKINTNSFGNYNPSPVKNPLKKEDVNAHQQPMKDQPNVTNEEREFFMGKYPENKNEIMDYHFYQRNGSKSGVSVGSLIDRRG